MNRPDRHMTFRAALRQRLRRTVPSLFRKDRRLLAAYLGLAVQMIGVIVVLLIKHQGSIQIRPGKADDAELDRLTAERIATRQRAREESERVPLIARVVTVLVPALAVALLLALYYKAPFLVAIAIGALLALTSIADVTIWVIWLTADDPTGS